MTDRSRLLEHGGSSLRLEPDAGVTAWTAAERALPPLVDARSPGSGLRFVDVAADRCWPGEPARTRLVASCGVVEVQDRLVTAAEPVGRAAPGVVLVRAVRCLDGPLDLTHRLVLAAPADGGPVHWWPLHRVLVGRFADRTVTVDGGAVDVRHARVSSRLRAGAGAWSVLTVAVDGRLPADDAALAAALGR